MLSVARVRGRKLDWRAQPRGVRTVDWDEAVRSFAPQTVFGLALCTCFAVIMPHILFIAAPVIIGLVFAVPFAVLTTNSALSRWSVRQSICAIPEEHDSGQIAWRDQTASARAAVTAR
ncbi:MAG: hypothetical protein AAF580_14170 [Pseudomonadota bacterium]